MKRLVILGAGGYGRTVADMARQSGQYETICFLDDQQTAENIVGKCTDYIQFADVNTMTAFQKRNAAQTSQQTNIDFDSNSRPMSMNKLKVIGTNLGK